MAESQAPGRPVHVALGAGLRAALVLDPIGLVLIPLVLRFPGNALEALQARFAGGYDPTQPAIAGALFVGWAFALFGLLLSQAHIIRRTAMWLRGDSVLPLEREFEGIFASFPTYLAVSLIFYGALFLGLFLLFIPGLIVLYVYGFAPQVAVLERTSWWAAFPRSRQVVRKQFRRWVVGALWIAGGLAVTLIAMRLVWAGLAEAYGGEVPFFMWLLGFFTIELVSVLFTVMWTAMFLDLKQRAETADSVLPQAREAAGLEFAPTSDEELERTRWQAG